MHASRTPIVAVAVLCLAFATVGLQAKPREVRHAGANGDGGSCPESVEDATLPARKPARRAAPAPVKAKPAGTSFRSGGDDTGRMAPRWHSFLPGMFR